MKFAPDFVRGLDYFCNSVESFFTVQDEASAYSEFKKKSGVTSILDSLKRRKLDTSVATPVESVPASQATVEDLLK